MWYFYFAAKWYAWLPFHWLAHLFGRQYTSISWRQEETEAICTITCKWCKASTEFSKPGKLSNEEMQILNLAEAGQGQPFLDRVDLV